MGTSIDRHSSISDYYKMGNAIPGIRVDGMNVLAVREGVRYAKEFCGSGNGPIYFEMMTYRLLKDSERLSCRDSLPRDCETNILLMLELLIVAFLANSF
jgi:TPP-dependent pyruvate/acetoin dehydrogenase alpha subunit